MNAGQTRFAVPQGTFDLRRYPVRPKEQLRAWDAGDEYALGYLGETEKNFVGRVLVVNDTFGALGVALAGLSGCDVQSWSDSSIAHLGLRQNLERNGFAPDDVIVVPSTADPVGPIDLVIVRIPKSNGLLEDQLRRLRPHLHAGSRIIGAGMAKHVHTSTLELFASIIGPTRTSLAQKKARLIFAELDPVLDPGPNPWPLTWQHDGRPLVNRAGVFAARKLDIGTRFFLKHLPATEGPVHVVDLGCGNGILGLQMARRNPDAVLTFVDESYASVASAEATMTAAFPHYAASFTVAHDLGSVLEAASVDVVINNPPFHQDHAVGDAVAWGMFRQSYDALRPGGELWVVGNRHLRYHLKMQRIFGNCDTVTGNPKFAVLRSLRA